jgi:Fibronectin type III domain
MVLASSTALAGKSARGNPPTATNFRVTAITAYTVALAWDPAPANSGDFNYHLWGAYNVGPTVILPKTATSYTFTGLYPGNYYTFGIYAKNASGNASTQVTLSNVRTLSDTTPPTTGPVVTVNEVGSNYAALSWTPPQDDGPHFTYEIWANGSLRATTGRDITSTILRSLAPATSYSITVRGRDEGYHWSPFSDPVSITTQTANPNDDTAPTTPALVSAYGFGDGSTEMQIQWAQSTDDFDVQFNIRYDVLVQRPGHRLRSIRRKHGRSLRHGYFRHRSAPATTTISF